MQILSNVNIIHLIISHEGNSFVSPRIVMFLSI